MGFNGLQQQLRGQNKVQTNTVAPYTLVTIDIAPPTGESWLVLGACENFNPGWSNWYAKCEIRGSAGTCTLIDRDGNDPQPWDKGIFSGMRVVGDADYVRFTYYHEAGSNVNVDSIVSVLVLESPSLE